MYLDIQFFINHIIPNIFTPILILYYVFQLDKSKCVTDWRGYYLKIFSIILLIFYTTLLYNEIVEYNNRGKPTYLSYILDGLEPILFIGNIIYITIIYTYVSSMSSCEYALSKHYYIHKFMLIWRYVIIFSIIIPVIKLLV